MNNEKKTIPLRLDAQLMDGLCEIARRDFRSLNGEIEYLISKELSSRFGGISGADMEKYAAFTWDGTEMRLEPVAYPDDIRLSGLKCYADEKREVVDNTLGFLDGLPAQNVLLYGDRGTGKSATVHAILNEYAKRGLRLIEMKKGDIATFPRLERAVGGADARYKFIVFIDDLSFEGGQDNYAELKAVLEGSISKIRNILIYATSNRRHLVKESFSARESDIHPGDALQEQVSLSDRFGITVTFMKPDRREFYEILSGILADRGLDVDSGSLARIAERFCLEKGGRTPRGAKQLADILESKIKRGQEI